MVETGRNPDSKTIADRMAAAAANWQGAPFEGLACGTRDATDPLYAHLAG